MGIRAFLLLPSRMLQLIADVSRVDDRLTKRIDNSSSVLDAHQSHVEAHDESIRLLGGRVDEIDRQFECIRLDMDLLMSQMKELEKLNSTLLSDLEDARNQRDMLHRKLFQIMGIPDVAPVELMGAAGMAAQTDRPRSVGGKKPWAVLRHELEMKEAKDGVDALEKYWRDQAEKAAALRRKAPNAGKNVEAVRENGPSDEGSGAIGPNVSGSGVRGEDPLQDQVEIRESLEA